MKRMMQFSVGGQTVDVPDDELEQFNAAAAQHGATPDRVNLYRVGDQTVSVPDSEREQFSAAANERGTRPEQVFSMSFSDGSRRDFTYPEFLKFRNSDEWLHGEQYRADREDLERRASEKASAPGYKASFSDREASEPTGAAGEVAHRMFTAEGIRKNTEENPNLGTKTFAYANDLVNSLIGGFLGGSSKITEGVGHAIGDNAVGRALVNEGRAGQAAIRQTLPTDALDTSGGGVVNKVLQTGKGVASMTGEFAPAAIPGVGQAYAASVVSAGSVNRAAEVFDAAMENGASTEKAYALATGAGAIDALQNILLMKGFRGIWGGAEKTAADAVKQSLVRRLVGDTVKTGATMGAGAAAQDVVNQSAGIDEKGEVVAPTNYDLMRTAKAGLDGFVEGGMFHLVNTGVHSLKKVDWTGDTKTMSARLAREVLDTPEGRALVMCNNPEAAKRILEARKSGRDVSRKMLEDLGIPSDVAPSKGDRNALADAVMGDYRKYKERLRVAPDAEQSAALNEAIAGIGAEGESASVIREEVLGKIKDAKELDDPKRRADLVYEAAKGLLGDITGIEGNRLTPMDKPVDKAMQERFAAQDKENARKQNEAAREAKRTAKADEAADAARAEQERLQAEAEQEAAIKEHAEEEAKPNAAVEEMKAAEAEAAAPKPRTEEYPEYAEWLRKNGKSDIDKNWNRFVAQNEMDPALKVVRDKKGNPVKPEPPAQAKPEVEGETKPVADETKTPVRETEGAENPAKTEPEPAPEAPAAVETPPEPAKTVPSGGRPIEEIMSDIDRVDREFVKAGRENDMELLARKREELGKLHGEYMKALAVKKKADAQEPAKTAPASAQGAEGTITPPKVAEPAQGAESTAGGVVEPKPDGKGRVVKPEPKSTTPVVSETGNTAEVVPPDSVEARISAMKRGSPEQLKAQREYLEQEIAKARAAIDGKFDEQKDYRGRHEGWTPKEDAGEIPPTVTVKVPGDGEFTVRNTPDGMAFLDKVAAKFKPQKSGKAAEASAPSVPRPPTVAVAKNPKDEAAHKEMEPFVSTDRTRASLGKPMSDGKYVYATNGKIVVRRPLQKGEAVKGVDGAPVESVAGFFDNPDPEHTFKVKVAELYPKLVQADAVTGEGDGKGIVELWHDGNGTLHVRARDGEGNSYATDAGSDYVSRPLTLVNGQYLRDFLKLAAKRGAGDVEIGIVKNGIAKQADAVTLKGGDLEGVLVSITKPEEIFKARAENDARLETNRMLAYGERAWVDSLPKKLREERDGLVATASQSGTAIDNELKAKIAKAKDDLAAFDAKHGKPEFVSEFVKNGGKAPAKPKKGKGGADGKLGSPDAPSPLRPVKNGGKAEQGELDLAVGKQGGGRRAKLSPDMSKPENARSFRTWLKEVPDPPTPEWLDDGSPKAVFDWFEKNMVGRTFAFDIPGYGHREFTVAPGHIGKLVCGGAGKGIITKPLSKGWMEAVRNGEVDAKDVNGWDAKRARMLPRVPVLLDSFDAVIHEFDTKHNSDVFTFIKRFNTKNGRPNTIVMKLVDDGKTIGPVSTHVKDITVSWLKNKDLILTEGGEVYGRSADDSASRKPPKGDNAEGNSPAGADSVPPTGTPVNGENLKTSDGQTIDRTGTPTKKNPLGQIVAPKEGSVAQAIDAEIAADEALAANGGGKSQGVPPAPAPGSAGNARLDTGYEPESIGAGVKNPVARQQIVDKFKELFGDTVAIRGKNTTPIGKSFSGHYEPNAGVIRSKDPVSLRTIPHEIGHHIDALLKRQGLARPANVRSELIALGRRLYGPKKPNGGYEAEGYAELIKYYLQGNDAGLKKETPAAYDWLTNKFGKANPDTMARLDAMRDMIDRLQNQSGEEAVRAIRAKNPSLAERVVKGIGRMVQAVKPTQENWLDTGAFITKGMRASGLHGLFDWQGALKRGDVAAMNDIIENHPVLKWKLYNGKAGARAYRALEKGLTDLSGTRRYTYGDLGVATPGHAANEALPTFREIFGDFTAREMDAFQDYAIARIAKEAYLDKGLEFGLTAKEVEPVIRKYANNAKFRDALERYTHYKHGVLHLLVDAGAMSQEQFEAIVAANPIYVKIARRRESTDFFKDKMLKRQGKAVNRRTGSGRQVEDIFDAGLIDDERVFAAAFQADLLRSLVNAGKRGERAGGVEAGFTTGANWLREVPNAQGEVKFTAEKLRKQITDAMQNAGQATDKATANTLFDALFDDGKDTLSVFKEKPSNGKNGLVSLYDQEGKLHTYELPENNAEGWAKGLMGFTDATKPNLLEQWAQIAAAATRSGATTLNPVFALRNIVKDTLHAATVNEFGAYIPGASTVQGIAMDMMDTNAAEIFKNMGIPMGSMLGESRLQSAHKANKYLMSKNWFVAQWNRGVKKAIADFVGFSENGSRIKEFKLARDYMLKHGASEKAADMIAGCNALDITIDFQRGGEASKAINRFIPFFNAGIQGIEQAARSLGLLRAKEWQLEQNRGKRAARTVLHGAAWLTSLALAAELYNRSDDERKKKADKLKPHEKWNYISFGDVRLPVPYEIGYVFASIPRAVAAEMYDGQEGAVGECLNMLRKTMPGLSPRDIALIGPALNVAMNESWTGSAIVPDHVMRGKRSYDWYDDRTTEFSKRLARAFHGIFGDSKVASPAHLDAFLNGVTGNMYGRILGTIEGESTFDEKRPHTWPVIGTFFRNNATASRVVSNFYERKEDLTRMKGSKEASGAELTELKSANKVAETLSSLRKAAETIRADTTLSTTERNDRLERISLKTQEICRNWSAWWREHRSAKK